VFNSIHVPGSFELRMYALNWSGFEFALREAQKLAFDPHYEYSREDRKVWAKRARHWARCIKKYAQDFAEREEAMRKCQERLEWLLTELDERADCDGDSERYYPNAEMQILGAYEAKFGYLSR